LAGPEASPLDADATTGVAVSGNRALQWLRDGPPTRAQRRPGVGSTGDGPAEVLSIFGRPGERIHLRTGGQ
jgi:hypothetical protein